MLQVLERSQEAMLGEAQQGCSASGGATGGLAHLLLNSYQERLHQTRLQEEQEREEGAQEEEEDDEEEEGKRGEVSGRGVCRLSHCCVCADHRVQQEEPTVEEKALLREEFISQMYQHFLDGKDKDFNYR